MPRTMFDGLCNEFRQYHTNSLNVALHLVTTPVGWCCALKLVHDSLAGDVPMLAWYLALAHSLLVLATTRMGPAICTALVNATSAAVAVSTQNELPMLYTFALLAASYAGQDVAHFITGEKTFQSSYSDPVKFMQHTVYLIPLCFDALFSLRRGPLYWFVSRDTTIAAKVTNAAALKTMREWVWKSKPADGTTTHWWYSDLSGASKDAFDSIANSESIMGALRAVWPSPYVVEVVHGMNEVYVASPTSMASSDKVFLMNHIDGPWIVWPFCSVYRVLVSVNENVQVSTVLKDTRKEVTLTTGDALGFDFNREIHKVVFSKTKKNPEARITLKVHYLTYPACLKPFGKLLGFVTTTYDIIARKLFLYTIVPKTFMQKLSARVGVLFTTYLVEQFEAKIGINNVMKVAAMALASYFLAGKHAARVFLLATSFIHYTIYIATFYYRSKVNYGRMLRDCRFWKAVSIGQLALYYSTFPIDRVSVAVMALGYSLSAWAAAAIGIDRTYFGSELGMVPPKWIDAFPYSSIPHPMILGSIVGLLGFYANEGFRSAYPELVPIHITLYAIHAAQEHLNIHDTKWKE